MELKLELKRTEYNIDCLGNAIKAVLSLQNGQAEIQLFINGMHAYYYLVESLEELSMDDADLIHTVSKKLFEDKKRWISDCTLIEDHLKDFKLVDKVSVYEAISNGYTFALRLSTTDNGDAGYIFRLVYTNDKNNDLLSCYVEAKDYEDLLHKSLIYAETIMSISNIFIKNQRELMKNAFSRYFKR